MNDLFRCDQQISNINYLLKEKGVTAQEAEAAIDIQPGTLLNYLANKDPFPTYWFVLKVSQYFGREPKDIFSREPIYKI